MPLLFFKPIYQERPWGGTAFSKQLNRALPGGKIGESWDIVDRPEACSVVAQGVYSGKSLRSLLEERSEYIMGPHWKSQWRFPLLVKWLDAAERLSLQVHPTQPFSEKHGGEPKTECWYFFHTEPHAGIFLGLKNGVSQTDFNAKIKESSLESCLHRISTQSGDLAFVPSGRLHAIDAGNVVLEIQQNSDTTYRVYDWGRIGDDGKPRLLHIPQALACADFCDTEPSLILPSASGRHYIDCPYFRLTIHDLAEGELLELPACEQPRIISCISGQLHLDGDINYIPLGSNGLQPFGEAATLRATGSSRVLVTDAFNKKAAG